MIVRAPVAETGCATNKVDRFESVNELKKRMNFAALHV